MVIVLYLVIVIGVIALVWGGVWFLKIAFDAGIGWGLACLLVPFAGIVFLVKRWETCKLPFFINLAGLLISLFGTMLLAGYTETAKVTRSAAVEWDAPVPITTRPVERDTWPDESYDLDDAGPVDVVGDTGTTGDTGTGDTGNSDFDPIPTPTPEARGDWSEDLMLDQQDTSPTPLPHWMKKWGEPLERSEYLEFLDAVVQVYTSDGQVFKAVLIAVYQDGIKVRQRVGTGFVEFYVKDDTITEIRAKK